MAWNKVKKQLESFISPSVKDCVEYNPTGYRYVPSKPTQNYITVNKLEVFNMTATNTGIKWYQTELDIKNDTEIRISITEEDIEKVRQQSMGKIPEERLAIIAKGHKASVLCKNIMEAQQQLIKSDFQKTVNIFLTESIEKSLESDDILLNIFGIIDRRVGKKRLQKMRDIVMMKHPVVRYFYQLRLNY